MASQPLRKQVHDPYVLGIDLGTTNSVVAVMKEDSPVVIPDKSGKNTIASLVHLASPETIGNSALAFLKTDPKNTVFASKRLIGRKFNDPDIQEYLKTLPYATVPSCNGDVWIKADIGKFSPAQIGGKILSHMRAIGERFLGKPVKRAVVTVPAYFNDCQKQATKDAGRIAGLDIIRIINEPTAAALAYGLDKNEPCHIAVYDLGGGTFDVSILELSDGIFHVKATNGHTFLGGEDFDNELVKFIVRQFEQEEGLKLETPQALYKVKLAAEEAKKILSTKKSTRIYIPDVLQGHDLDLNVSREQFESVVKRIAQRTIEPCEKAIRDAHIAKGQIKHVIMVGGMTRMLGIQKLAESIFGVKPTTSINPDEAVAKGAAIQAGILAGTVQNVLLLDIAPLSLGIEVSGGVFSKIVEKNTTLPFKRTETFTTSTDNQEYVDIRVFQGERSMVADNKYLGSIRLVNIPKAPRGVPRIDVTFEADANGITKVTAQDSATKRKQEIVITPSSGLSEEEIARMISEAEKNAAEDRKNIELAEFKDQATKFIDDFRKRELPGDMSKQLEELALLVDKDVGAARKKLNEMQNIL